MKRHSRSPLALEALEDRYCPAITAGLDLSGDLNISGTPSAPFHTLTVNETAPDLFTVQDGASTIGVFFVSGNISIHLGTLAATTTVFMPLNGNATPGAVTMNLGNGPNDVTVAGAGGTINGNLTVNAGASNDIVTVDGTTVNGNLNSNLGGSTGGDSLTVTDGSVINGNISAVNVDNFELTATGIFGPASSVGGSVSLSDLKGVLVNYSFDGAGGVGNSSVAGNVVINTNSGFSSSLLQFSGDILGSLIATVGKGNSIINLNPNSTVNGSVTLLTGSSSPSTSTITLDTDFIGGNLTVVQGTGTSLTQVLPGATILGTSIRYQGGAGNHRFEFNGSAPAANLYAYMGSGIQEFDLTPGALLASGTVVYGAGTTTTSLAPVVNFPFHVRHV